MGGTTKSHTLVRSAQIKAFKYRMPSESEHMRQLLLSSPPYDELIENNRRRIALLEEAARLLYREWFVHFRFPGHEHAKITRRSPLRGGKDCLRPNCVRGEPKNSP